MDCFFVAFECRVRETFSTFCFSRFLHVSFFKSSTFRFAGFTYNHGRQHSAFVGADCQPRLLSRAMTYAVSLVSHFGRMLTAWHSARIWLILLHSLSTHAYVADYIYIPHYNTFSFLTLRSYKENIKHTKSLIINLLQRLTVHLYGRFYFHNYYHIACF